MELEQNNLPKPKTPKQEAFIVKLLQSRWISKKDFRFVWKHAIPSMETSLEASYVIEFLLGQIRFKERFYNKRFKARTKCYFCSEKKNIGRYWNYAFDSEIGICKDCELNIDKKEDFEQQRDRLNRSVKVIDPVEAEAINKLEAERSVDVEQ